MSDALSDPATNAGDAGAHPFAAPVREVTLFEDRARVARAGVVELPSGRQRLLLAGVAPVLSDATLLVHVESPGARPVDVRARRRRIPRHEDPDPLRARLTEERERAEARVARQEAALLRGEREIHDLAQLAELELSELSEDAAWERDEREVWSSRLDRLRERERGTRDRVEETRAELEQALKEKRRVCERLAALDSPERREHAELLIELEVATAGEHHLRVEYVVPGACWRPYHSAQLLDSGDDDDGDGAGARVRFQTDACVWQRSGEDWSDVRLRFSTQRPSQGTDPPALGSDVLAVQPKAELTQVEARDVEIATTGLGGDGQGAGAGAGAGAGLPGIDDGGEGLSLDAEHPASVPSDGRPWRIPLFRFESPAEVDLAAWPERVAAVLLRSTQTNAGTGPILAGPVDLIRNGGYAGRSALLYVAAGERFALGWGPDPELRVERHSESVPEKRLLPGAWPSRHHLTRVHVSNLGTGEKRLAVRERMPVSEIDKVQVELDRRGSDDAVQPDTDGIVSWPVTLPAGGRQELRLAWTLKHHPEVRGV